MTKTDDTPNGKTPDPEEADGPLEQSLESEAFAWVMQFAAGKAGPAEFAALQQWVGRSPHHAEAFERLSRTWRGIGTVASELAGAHSRPHQLPPERLRRGQANVTRRAMLGGAVAASAAAGTAWLLGHPPMELWPSLSEMRADYRTAVGERREVAVAPDVSIDMNTRTSISAGAEPELITGEAAVSARGSGAAAFTLRAAGGRIVARDASFNVRTDESGACVSCLAGHVLVENRGASLTLSQGQQVSYSGRGLEPVIEVDPTTVSAWQQGIVIFKSTPVAEVIAEINRYRPGRVILTDEALGRRLFNARLRIANIDKVVEQIEQTFGAKATRLLGGIVLLG